MRIWKSNRYLTLIANGSSFEMKPKNLEIHDGEQILGSNYLGNTCLKGRLSQKLMYIGDKMKLCLLQVNALVLMLMTSSLIFFHTFIMLICIGKTCKVLL